METKNQIYIGITLKHIAIAIAVPAGRGERIWLTFRKIWKKSELYEQRQGNIWAKPEFFGKR